MKSEANIFDMGVPGVQAKFDVIRAHCEDVGRDYDDIEKTVLSVADFGTESTDQIVERFGRLAEIGTQQVIVGGRNLHKPDALDAVPDLVRQLTPL